MSISQDPRGLKEAESECKGIKKKKEKHELGYHFSTINTATLHNNLIRQNPLM